jgi:hypothetical protein
MADDSKIKLVQISSCVQIPQLQYVRLPKANQ